jgi:hypothetical protein
MFSEGGVLVMICGILLGLFVIGGAVYYVNKMFADNTQEILVRFILLIFTSLVALFIVDKVIAWQIKLLSDEQNGQLFDLIKTLVLMIFSYYFGTKEGVETNGKQNKEDKE